MGILPDAVCRAWGSGHWAGTLRGPEKEGGDKRPHRTCPGSPGGSGLARELSQALLTALAGSRTEPLTGSRHPASDGGAHPLHPEPSQLLWLWVQGSAWTAPGWPPARESHGESEPRCGSRGAREQPLAWQAASRGGRAGSQRRRTRPPQSSSSLPFAHRLQGLWASRLAHSLGLWGRGGDDR